MKGAARLRKDGHGVPGREWAAALPGPRSAHPCPSGQIHGRLVGADEWSGLPCGNSDPWLARCEIVVALVAIPPTAAGRCFAARPEPE